MVDNRRVLVAYGTKYGATAEIAEAIGKALNAEGLEVDVSRARRVRSLDAYRAVVLGSAVYAGRWRRDAMRLLRRPQLRKREVWLFSSGPVGEDRGDPEKLERFTKPKRVQEYAARTGMREPVVFGGRISDDAGFIRKKMAAKIPPELRDRRDWHQIEAWARSVAAALQGAPEPAEPGVLPAATVVEAARDGGGLGGESVR